jgi:hypothetical protein
MELSAQLELNFQGREVSPVKLVPEENPIE